MQYINTMEYYSAINKNEIVPFVAPRINLEIIILSEVSHTKTNIIWYYLYVVCKKVNTYEFIYRTEKDSQTYRTNL